MESVPTKPSVQILFFQDGAAIETLVDCGPFRYHLLVQYYDDEDGCQENTLLKNVYDALDEEDEPVVDEARNKCMELVWPLMFADYARRVASNQKSTGTIKLRAITQHRVVCATDHELHLEYPPMKPVKNEYPDVVTVSFADVETLEKNDHAILKVKVRTGTYCLKRVHQKLNVCCFQREIKMLQGCSHPNIICLCYLVTDKDNMVEAMLLEYIMNARQLSNIESLSGDQYARWIAEIRDTIMYLHFNELVWGDAKLGNVLIHEDDRVVLIDFGGGHMIG